MITSMRRCVACDDLWPWPISSRSFDLDFENRVRSVMFSVLDRLFFWLGIQYDPIVWVIMRRRGVSSERRRSSCSSLLKFQDIIWLQFCKFWTFPNFRPISVYNDVNLIYLWYTWGQNVLLQNCQQKPCRLHHYWPGCIPPDYSWPGCIQSHYKWPGAWVTKKFPC